MRNIIVIPTHRSGVKLLDNLLDSFKGYDKYPILIVISDYKQGDQEIFSNIRKKFSNLPIVWEIIKTNSFELGGLYTAYVKTDSDEFFLLSHSCEIVNTNIFDIVFEKYKNKSVALGVQPGNWKYGIAGMELKYIKFVLRHLDPKVNLSLIDLGKCAFWQGHIGKYRREILDKMDLLDYLPTNMLEAISKSEILFTCTYQALEHETVVLFSDWRDSNVFEEKFNKKRLKIQNEYIIKWKTHWSIEMVCDDMKEPPSAEPEMRNAQVIILETALTEERKKTESLTKAIEEERKKTESLTKAIEKRESLINVLFNSKSWKVTALLRWCSRRIRTLKSSFKQLVN
jgi:hypothetical protein